jgi:hypothetical protein
MKCVLQIIFLFGVLFGHSQSKPKPSPLKQLSQSDTVIFSAHNSGCFNSGTNTYTIVKLKTGERHIEYRKAGTPVTKKISSKKFDSFLLSFKNSMNRFKDPDEKSKCTMVSDFELKNREQGISFRNGSCEAQFNPEETLLQLLK